MPSYHLSAQVIKRSAGRSAVAAAAYRAGERLRDSRAGIVHDYSRRRGVLHAEIMAPRDAPDWMRDRARLWNAVEKGEKRSDAQLAREMNVALPHELTDEQRLELVRGFVDSQFVSRGMVADFAIHEPVREHGDDPRNHHAHIMLTMRKAGRGGFHQTKTREWNSDDMLKAWRAAWADEQNRALGRGGSRERVDHRSLVTQREEAQRQGDRRKAAELNRQPEIHIGPGGYHALKWGRKPRSSDRPAGPIRNRKGLRPGEWKFETHRSYVDGGATEGNWLKRQFADRRTIERREYNDRARRLVRYTVIDHGTRFEENMRRLERNTARMGEVLDRLQKKAARFRLRRHWLTQSEYEARQRLQTLAHEREQQKRRRLWQKKRDEEALYRALFARQSHFKRRQSLANGLIDQIDGVVRSLLLMKEKQLNRRNVLFKERNRNPVHGRRDGRGRRE